MDCRVFILSTNADELELDSSKKRITSRRTVQFSRFNASKRKIHRFEIVLANSFRVSEERPNVPCFACARSGQIYRHEKSTRVPSHIIPMRTLGHLTQHQPRVTSLSSPIVHGFVIFGFLVRGLLVVFPVNAKRRIQRDETVIHVRPTSQRCLSLLPMSSKTSETAASSRRRSWFPFGARFRSLPRKL